MDADRLREVAKGYELSAHAAEERGDVQQALVYSAVAIALYEIVCVENGAGLEEAA